MKTLSLALFLLAGLPGLRADDPCACGGCAGVGHVDALGNCVACAKQIGSRADKYCGACASSKKACIHCGKALRNPQVFVGSAARVDKQPRADLEYVVCIADDGKRQGIYHNPKVNLGFKTGLRALLWTSEGPQGELLLRQFRPLEPKERDLELRGKSETPVRWRIGEVAGPEIAPKDGEYRICLPALPWIPVEVVAGDKVLSTHVLEKLAWRTR